MSKKEFERIYVLCDPRTDEIRYVGKTDRTLKVRLKEHLQPSRLKDDTHRTRWIKCLINLNLKPIIQEIEKSGTGSEAEIFWIEYLKSKGHRLTNGTPGGDGLRSGSKRPKEVALKISKGLTGKKRAPFSEEWKRKMGESRTKKRPFFDQNGNVYQTAFEAAKKLGFIVDCVRHVLNGSKPSHYGYFFRYLDQDIFSDQNFFYQDLQENK